MTSSSSIDPTPPLTESSTPASTRGPATPAPSTEQDGSSSSQSQIPSGGKGEGQGGGECTPAHVLYCFDVLMAHFEGRKPISPPFEGDKKMYVYPGVQVHLDLDQGLSQDRQRTSPSLFIHNLSTCLNRRR